MMGHGTPGRVTRPRHRIVLLEPATPSNPFRFIEPSYVTETARVVPSMKRATPQSPSPQECPYNLHSHAFGSPITKLLIVFCLLHERNVPIRPSPYVQKRARLFRHRRSSPELLEARQDTLWASPVTPQDIRHFHDRKPLRRALEQV